MGIKSVIGAVLIAASFTSQAAVLQNGDTLNFTTAAGSYIEGIGGGSIFDSASLDSLNGLTIGVAQPSGPDIDQTWTAVGTGVTGYHRTTSAVTVLDEYTLDFSGWIMVAGGSDHAFGATQGIANYVYDGTNFTLDYYWNATNDNGGVPIGGFVVSDYHLHLAGTVSPIPVPAAVWLFGSGLLGLIGVARSKRITG